MFKKMVEKVLIGTTRINGVVRDVKFNVSRDNVSVISGNTKSKVVKVYEDEVANEYVRAYQNGTANENWIDLFNALEYSDFSAEQYLTTRFTTYNLFSIYRLIVKEPKNAFIKETIGKLNAFCGREIILDGSQLKRAILKVIKDRLNYFSDEEYYENVN